MHVSSAHKVTVNFQGRLRGIFFTESKNVTSLMADGSYAADLTENYEIYIL